jgi:hypothetical protein
MNVKILICLLVSLMILKYTDVYSQNTENSGNQGKKLLDSISVKGLIHNTNNERPIISLSKDQALKYLQNTYRTGNWNNQ